MSAQETSIDLAPACVGAFLFTALHSRRGRRIVKSAAISRSCVARSALTPQPDRYLYAAIELNPIDRREGSWTKLELLAMNQCFSVAMARAPEALTGDGPDRVAESLLPPRRP
jgi:hypothetical protein